MHKKEEELVDEARISLKLLDSYKGARNTWALNAIEDADFRKGAQWTRAQIKELKARQQSPIVVNVIHPTVEQAKALLTANRPRFTVVGREESDVKMGKVLTDLLTYIWDFSDGNVEVKKAIDDYYVMGLGYLVPYYDPYHDRGKGEICFKSVSPLDIFVDPNSQDFLFRDATNILINRVLSEFQLKQLFPTIDTSQLKESYFSRKREVSSRLGSEGQGSANEMVNDTEHRHYDLIDRFSKKKIMFFRIDDTITGWERTLSQEQYMIYLDGTAIVQQSAQSVKYIYDDGIKEALQVYQQTGGIFHYMANEQTQQPTMMAGEEDEKAIPGSTHTMTLVKVKDLIQLGVLTVAQYLETRIQRVISVEKDVIFNDLLPIDEYPIVPLCNHHDRSPYPLSDVRLGRGIQEAINKIRSLIIAHAANSTNSKWWVPRGAINKKELEEGFQKAGVFIGEYDAELGVPTQASPTPLPNELYKNEADFKADIERLFGIYSFMQGDTSSSPKTYKGTIALDEYGQRRIKSKQHDIEAALNHLGRILIKLVQQYYTEQKIIRVISPNMPTREIQINQPIFNDLGKITRYANDVTIGAYDVVVITGSMLPSNRWARFDYYMQLFQQGLIDQEEVLKQTEIVDMEGVLERFSQMNQMRQQLAQSQEEIKRLSGDLQTSQREGVQDRKRVEVEKFKTKLNVSLNDNNLNMQKELLKLQQEKLDSTQDNPPLVPLNPEDLENDLGGDMFYN